MKKENSCFLRGANARNVSFQSLYGGQFILSTQLINQKFRVSRPHQRSTTVSLETNPLVCSLHTQLFPNPDAVFTIGFTALTLFVEINVFFLGIQYEEEQGWRIWEQGWRSGESTRLPPMWPGFDSRSRFSILC